MFLLSGNKTECCGCTACQQICSVNAIAMKPDEDGFFFPVKDLNTCTNCGACERVCPFTQPQYGAMPERIYACRLVDEKECRKSTSGGAFFALASRIVTQGGVVFGAGMGDNLQVYHMEARNLEDLQKLRGSKYVQSVLNDSFRIIRTLLKQGTQVLFSGTGCQVAGLKAFLRKDYSNLTTIDLICHGVPNQHLFDEHISWLRSKYKGEIINYNFRNNEKWSCCEIFTIKRGKRIKQIIKPTFLLSPYLYSFMFGYTYRMACYNCPFAHVPRQGDLTIGDYWGIQKFYPHFKCESGASLVLINSKRGMKVWEEICDAMLYVESNLNDAAAYNANLTNKTSMPKQRNGIYRMLREEGYAKMARTVFRPKNYLLVRIKYILKDFLNIY